MEEEVIPSVSVFARCGLRSPHMLQDREADSTGEKGTTKKDRKNSSPVRDTSRLMFSDLNNYLVSLYKHRSCIVDSGQGRGSLWVEACLTRCLAPVCGARPRLAL